MRTSIRRQSTLRSAQGITLAVLLAAFFQCEIHPIPSMQGTVTPSL